jgi:chemotaxis protein MotB
VGRKKPHDEHVNHERWLVSYADFITLLFAFFVVMYSISELDKRKMMKIKQNIQFGLANKKIGEDENPFAFFDDQSQAPFGDLTETPSVGPTPKQKDGGKNVDKQAGSPSFDKIIHQATVITRHLNQIKRQIQAILISQGLRGNKLGIEIELIDDGLRIRIPGRVIFEQGKTKLKAGTWDVLSDITKIIADSPLPARIDGHEAASDKGSIETNDWEMSLLRATRLLRFLIAKGNIDPERIIAAGHGAHRPVRDEDSDDARYANERYEIVILANADFTKGYITKGK